MESSFALPSLGLACLHRKSSGQPVTYFLAQHDPKSCGFLSFMDSPFYGITASGDRRKTSECQSIFSSLLCGKGKGGLCQKEMFLIVLINCSISPRIAWAAGINLTSAVLLYFLEAIQVSVEIHTNANQPTSVRSIARRVPNPGCLLNIQVGHVEAPFSTLDTTCFWGITTW